MKHTKSCYIEHDSDSRDMSYLFKQDLFEHENCGSWEYWYFLGMSSSFEPNLCLLFMSISTGTLLNTKDKYIKTVERQWPSANQVCEEHTLMLMPTHRCALCQQAAPSMIIRLIRFQFVSMCIFTVFLLSRNIQSVSTDSSTSWHIQDFYLPPC